MKIQSASPAFKANPVKVLVENNKHKKYLYNEVIDIVKKDHLSAVVHNKGIDLLSTTKDSIEKLKKAGINFNKVV